MSRIFVILLIAFFCGGVSRAQSDTFGEPEEDAETENLYEETEKREAKKTEEVKKVDESQHKDLSKVSELVELAPFEDVAVISRRFLPRTNRFEIGTTAILGMNNAFFNNWGLGLGAAYFFNDKHGVEFKYYFLEDSPRSITRNLEDRRNVETRSLVVPENFLGLAYRWTPMYGKVALLNRKIIPFDLYFSGGAGSVSSNGESSTAFHLAGGQNYALSKSLAVGWSLTLNYYQAKVEEETSPNVFEETTKSQTDLFLGVGAMFYFPEATYR